MAENKTTSAKVTEKEVECLEAICRSEYQNGDGDDVGARVVDYDVWTFSLDGVPKAARGGLLASLQAKGFVRLGEYEGDGRANDEMVAITRAGFDALQAARAGK